MTPGSQVDRSLMMRLPVAHDQGMTLFVSQVAQGLDVLLHLNFQGGRDHATRTFPGQVIQRLHDFWSLCFRVICGKLDMAYPFRGLHSRSWDCVHPKDTPPPLYCQSTTSDYISSEV